MRKAVSTFIHPYTDEKKYDLIIPPEVLMELLTYYQWGDYEAFKELQKDPDLPHSHSDLMIFTDREGNKWGTTWKTLFEIKEKVMKIPDK